MPLLRKPKTEAEIAAAHAEQVAADLAAQRGAEESFEHEGDSREPTGQPSPGAVQDVTRSVERAFEEGTPWSAFCASIERPCDSPRAKEEALELLERQIERRRQTIKHSPNALDRRRAEARMERLERQHSEIFAALHDVHTAGEPILRGWPCPKCGDEFPDRASRYSHRLRCRPTY